MSRAYFRVQLVLVAGLIALVSWPEFRASGHAPATVWRTNGPLVPGRDLSSDRRIAAAQATPRLVKVGYGSRAALAATPDRREPDGRNFDTTLDERRIPDMPRAAVPSGRLNAIVGLATTSLNTPIAFARLVLRNTTTGRVEARAVADRDGRFTFLDMQPSGYIVELVDGGNSVIAASNAIAIAAGDMKQATIRVASTATLPALFGQVTGATASAPVEAAVQTNVPRVTAQDVTLSPRQ